MNVVSNRPAASGLYCHHLSVMRGRKRVLNNVSLAVGRGEMVGILGANGAGKSTLLSTLAGELAIDSSLHRECPVLVNGRSIVELTVPELSRLRAVLPQNPELIFDLAVEEVVSMGLYPFPELDRQACQALLDEAIAQADIGHLWERRYLELSGGEQQRVQFARTLAQVLAASRAGGSGCYLLLDEPSSSLDPAHQHGLLRAARQAATQAGAGVLVVLHDVNLAALYCDRLALMADGGVLACGSPQEVLLPGLLQQVYGTAAHVQAHPMHAHVPLVVFL
ncbi:heme ABC transporter ATP-binding protein [Achromobacter sp. F4_2707]|uniref:heme ABC transporter ATP-binding protein n=1 Tax=Achromobacter sp. F4_2707 TaxID=3114286 RepID=UPI0039C6C4C2